MAEGIPPTLPSGTHHGDNLALLYQGVLTSIVRVQSGRQAIADANAFRKRIQDALAEVMREATQAGYAQEDVNKTNYAVTAFLEETLSGSRGPGETRSGERFFDDVQALQSQQDSPQLADVLEVQYLCLLLGYRGQYVGDRLEGLNQIMNELHVRIERVRGQNHPLSPAGLPSGEAPAPPAPVSRTLGSLSPAILTVSVLVLIPLCWVLFWLLLNYQSSGLEQTVQMPLRHS
jgi:type VI secretion system protein ImpK